ncbi:MAG: porin family protein [Prevotella sp.]|nr:porin family protein [Prevotella sp.]
MNTTRKLLLILLFSLSGITMYAQKGMNGVGINIVGHQLSGTDSFSFGADLKYHYNFNNHMRIEPFVAIMNDEYQIGLNYNVFVGKVKRLRPYFIVSAAFGTVDDDIEINYEGDASSSFMFKVGFGLNYRISRVLSWQIELLGGVFSYEDYDYSTSFEGIFPQIKTGLAYNF